MKSYDSTIWLYLIQSIFASYAFVSMHYSTDFLLNAYYVSCTVINVEYRVVNKTAKVLAIIEFIIW